LATKGGSRNGGHELGERRTAWLHSGRLWSVQIVAYDLRLPQLFAIQREHLADILRRWLPGLIEYVGFTAEVASDPVRKRYRLAMSTTKQYRTSLLSTRS
jgi:hypothetical protein